MAETRRAGFEMALSLWLLFKGLRSTRIDEPDRTQAAAAHLNKHFEDDQVEAIQSLIGTEHLVKLIRINGRSSTHTNSK